MQLPVRCSEKGNTTKLMKDEQEANFGKGDLHRLAVGAILVVQLFGKHCD